MSFNADESALRRSNAGIPRPDMAPFFRKAAVPFFDWATETFDSPAPPRADKT